MREREREGGEDGNERTERKIRTCKGQEYMKMLEEEIEEARQEGICCQNRSRRRLIRIRSHPRHNNAT